MTDRAEVFIQKATEKHNGKYDYSRVNYVNSQTKVEIICRKHGPFNQVPAMHVHRSGCPLCKADEHSKRSRKTSAMFIAEAKEIHGNRYDYSKVDYITSKTKVEIICGIHGSFFQSPNSHLKGNGCPNCKGSKLSSDRTFSNDEFIGNAKLRHGDRYLYDKTVYTKGSKKVEIGCKEHGYFWQTANDHVQGAGCPTCATAQKAAKMRVVMRNTTHEFVESANKVHNGVYSYEKTEYKDCKTNVVITCPVHGDFIKRPSDHLAGGGCQACSSKGFNKNGDACIYVLSNNDKVKVGISGKGGKKRAQKISSSYGETFDVSFEMWGKGHVVQKVEKEVLSILRSKYESPATVFEGYTECFLDVDVITVIDMIYEAMERLK